METIYNSKVSFGTNIVFISPKGMRHITKKMRKGSGYMQIDNWYLRPPDGDIVSQGYRTDCALGYTYGVKSCSSGVSVKKGGKAPYFWHIEDTPENIRYLCDIRGLTNCDNVILFGSKSKFRLSRKLFKKFENFIKTDSIPATILKGLSLRWQACAAYVAKNDTLFLCVQKIGDKARVDSMEKLKEIFETIKISPTDKLKFPNFIQEFLMIRRLKIEK